MNAQAWITSVTMTTCGTIATFGCFLAIFSPQTITRLRRRWGLTPVPITLGDRLLSVLFLLFGVLLCYFGVEPIIRGRW